MNKRLNKYYGDDLAIRLKDIHFAICGAGALGSNLADNLLRHGARNLTVLDCDRVEAVNIGTQVYDVREVGMYKAEALARRAYHIDNQAVVTPIIQCVSDSNVHRLLKPADIILDTFDNYAARQAVFEAASRRPTECLHIGMNAGYAAARWNDGYQVPQDDPGVDVCDYAISRNLILAITGVATELLFHFILTGERHARAVTIGDLRIWEL